MRHEADDAPVISPCVILALNKPDEFARIGRYLRSRGWDTYGARTGPEARRLTLMLRPDLIVLETELPEESGWLVCNKLTHELPGLRVLLYQHGALRPAPDFADFVGAYALATGIGELTGYLRSCSPVAQPV